MYSLQSHILYLFLTKAMDMAHAAQQHSLALELRARNTINDQECQQERAARAYGSFDAWCVIEASINKAWDAWEEDENESHVKQCLLVELRWNMGITAATLALSQQLAPVHQTSLSIQQAFYRYMVNAWPL
ncbi:hypothetical protein [Ktedonospora formicarum]|uniref:Uncharacterized protein n=1 Tax=Ktedonospora formicarum TaxID=2778364 RepID=A0A8J3I815_9CHLR|nr:hypothetical protein [Ktedonospora formicarum]GHO49171.1 hypothetical protein KSX_73340 [Ktedonospora formicarum]